MKLLRRFGILAALVIFLTATLPSVAFAGVGDGIVQRFWDGVMSTITKRLTSEVPVVTGFLQEAENAVLKSDDFTSMPAVQDVFKGMRVAGLMLLAFTTVISLVELTESGITGGNFGLMAWFKRFLVSTLLTFGGLQFYGLWIRLFDALLLTFRGYLDTHWTSAGHASVLYELIVQLLSIHAAPFLILPFIALVTITILLLAFLVGGVRKAEMIIGTIIAPLVWPIYMIPSLDDIPKTAFRSFLGLNATLLIVVAILRMAIRLALGTGAVVNIWQLMTALALLVMTVFVPPIVKRIVGQGHTGMGAVMTAVNLAAGLKFLSLGVAAAGAAAAPAAGSVAPMAAPGPSAYPLATVSQPHMAPAGGGMAGAGAQSRIRTGLPSGAGASQLGMLEAPLRASEVVLDLVETAPGQFGVDQGLGYERIAKLFRDHAANTPQDGGKT